MHADFLYYYGIRSGGVSALVLVGVHLEEDGAEADDAAPELLLVEAVQLFHQHLEAGDINDLCLNLGQKPTIKSFFIWFVYFGLEPALKFSDV